MGESAKTYITDADDEQEATQAQVENKPVQVKSKRGAKQIQDAQPAKSARVIFDQAKPIPRPINVYNELINSTDGKTSRWAWWTIDGESQPMGRQEIVKINPRTEEERTIGYEYTILYSAEVKKKLLAERGPRTKFYHKDGEVTHDVRPEDW